MNWIEISLTVSGELAEAVAEVLSRYCSNGVTTEQGVRHLDDGDVGTPDGPITVRAYLPADSSLDGKRAQIVRALHYLGMIQPLPAPAFRPIADQNWMEAWQKHYRPIVIGRRLMVVPAWMEPEDPTRIAVKIDPGMAFGTGTHPSTQLCLQFIDSILDSVTGTGRSREVRPATNIIDVGCGSGILSIAALKLGAVSALGVDTDAEAVRNARGNAALNGIGGELILEVGSVREILDGNFGIKSAPLVVVNILAPVIADLFGEGLARLLEPGGALILAGILETQASDVENAARRAGMIPQGGSAHMGEWVALLCRPGPVTRA
jgi:ribosomal protein L11 methyltransferase